jgi:hypothetical protein
MKQLISFIVLIGILGLIGCQNYTPVEPNSTVTKKTNLQFEFRDRIDICCEICDPITGICRLDGVVEYIHQIIEAPENPDGLYEISLTLEMSSQLCDRCMIMHLPWIAEGISTHTVYVSEEGIALVERGYLISNRNDIMLYVQYLVTTEGVGIPNMWIQEIDQ